MAEERKKKPEIRHFRMQVAEAIKKFYRMWLCICFGWCIHEKKENKNDMQQASKFLLLEDKTGKKQNSELALVTSLNSEAVYLGWYFSHFVFLFCFLYLGYHIYCISSLMLDSCEHLMQIFKQSFLCNTKAWNCFNALNSFQWTRFSVLLLLT